MAVCCYLRICTALQLVKWNWKLSVIDPENTLCETPIFFLSLQCNLRAIVDFLSLVAGL